MIQVLWVPQRSRGSWDMNLIEELTAGPEFNHGPPLCPPPEMDGAVVVLAGQHSVDVAQVYADQIARLPWSLVIVTSDEEALFPVELLPRDERHVIWGQYHARPEFERVIPIGAPPGTRADGFAAVSELVDLLFGIEPEERTNAVMFAGQDTHERRHELLAVMKEMAADVHRYGDIGWCATTGFAQGLNRRGYLAALENTRIAPCPSGPHSLDSFRLYEALAAGALPIIETCTPHGDEGEFWDALFGPHRPIPRIASWAEALPLIAEEYADPIVWRETRDEIQRWWVGYREDLEIDFANTIRRLQES